MVIRKLQSCTSAAFKNIYFSSVLLLLIVNLNVSALKVEQNPKAGVSTSSSVNNIINKNLNSNNNKTEVVEGSADGAHGRLADVEVNGSGYPTDDEDGDDVHGSGSPPPTSATPVKPKLAPPQNIAVTTKPSTTTMSAKPTLAKPVTNTDRQKELKVDSEEDDDDDDEDDEDDDEDFADENINDDMDVFTTSTTTSKPFVAIMSTTPRSLAQPTPIPPRINQNPTSTVSSGPFSPFHETMTNGFYAAIAGGVLVAVITAILLVLFVVFRIRKKDEGSYALDEPKQTRPYATYAYTKASTKEFYA